MTFWLLCRSFAVPALLVVGILLAVTNAINAGGAVRTNFATFEHTRAQYAANGMSVLDDLAKPAHVTTQGGEQVVTNLARYDYDALASSILATAPGAGVPETLGYLGLLYFPLVFFLLGLLSATLQRRYRLDKVVFARRGITRTAAARLVAAFAGGAAVVVACLVADAIARAVVRAQLESQLPLATFVPLAHPAPADSAAQWGVVLLVALFFTGGGVTAGHLFGVFALPAIVFVIGDLVLPIAVAGDPRNWFAVLARSVFSYSDTFTLAEPVAMPPLAALLAAITGAGVLTALALLAPRLRNPRAT